MGEILTYNSQLDLAIKLRALALWSPDSLLEILAISSELRLLHAFPRLLNLKHPLKYKESL